jgi:hypothetical protein
MIILSFLAALFTLHCNQKQLHSMITALNTQTIHAEVLVWVLLAHTALASSRGLQVVQPAAVWSTGHELSVPGPVRPCPPH